MSERNESSENEVLAQELDSIGSKVLDVERRLAEVERVIQGLESAAMTTARALDGSLVALGLRVQGDAPR